MHTFLPEKHYPKAPITEAVIDILAKLPDDFSVESLEGAADEAYPRKDSLLYNEVRVSGATTTTKQRPLGWRFHGNDSRYVYQARLNGFGASHLAPYENWTTFSSEARRLWDRYRACVRPVALQRLGVRYINRLDLPLPLNDFGEYLQTTPTVSPHLPQALSNYVMSLTIPMDDDVVATVTEAILNEATVTQPGRNATNRDVVSVLLDVDVSFRVAGSMEDPELWSQFEHLRKVKNHVFESCITDKARELFQ